MDKLINWWASLTIETREKLLLAIATALVTIFLTSFVPKVVWPVLLRLLVWIREQIYRQLAGLPFFNWWGLRRYRKSLYTTLERIANPWSRQKLLLENIFVPVKVDTKYLLPHFVPGRKSPEDLVDLRSAAREYQRFILVGAPGGGKTTAMKSLGLAALKGILYADRAKVLPVFLELRHYAVADTSLDVYLVQVFDSFGFPKASRFIERALSKGHLFLLLDALDEVPEGYFQKVVDAIHEFCNRYSNNRIVITCRTAAYERQFDDLSDGTVGLAHFSDIQIATFLRRWDFPSGKSPVQLMQIFRERPTLLAICRNPLLLTITTSLYVETDYELPRSRVEFYTTCVDAVLKRWDYARHVERHNKSATAKFHLHASGGVKCSLA